MGSPEAMMASSDKLLPEGTRTGREQNKSLFFTRTALHTYATDEKNSCHVVIVNPLSAGWVVLLLGVL